MLTVVLTQAVLQPPVIQNSLGLSSLCHALKPVGECKHLTSLSDWGVIISVWESKWGSNELHKSYSEDILIARYPTTPNDYHSVEDK